MFVWAHVLIVLAFLTYLPKSKHLHIITAAPNVFFAKNGPSGYLAPERIDLESAEEDMRFGVATAQDLSKKQLLDLFSCTECGRCQEVCPAWATGKPLSPKLLIMDLRDHVAGIDPAAMAAGTVELQPLVPNAVTDEVVWDCVTCGACVRECPVDIEHVDTIVDLRRNLVMAESRFPSEAGTMLRGVEGPNENPWGQPAASRTDWIGDIPVRVLQPGEQAPEYLFWVGCAGRVRRAREADDAKRRPAVERGGDRVGRARPARAVHRRPGAAHGPRVPLPDARRAERGDLRGGRRPEDRRDLRALLQHAGQRVPRLRGHPSRSCITPSCSHT